METDKLEKIKEMITKVLELDDQLDTLKDERKSLIKDYVKEHDLDMKQIEMAIKAIKKDIDLSIVEKIVEALEPVLK
jgi:DNA integrity scanning protein DisA with diadenylate cyclase activity